MLRRIERKVGCETGMAMVASVAHAIFATTIQMGLNNSKYRTVIAGCNKVLNMECCL